MNMQSNVKQGELLLVKANPAVPAFKVTGRTGLSIRAGTTIAGTTFKKDTPVHLGRSLEPGRDYCIYLGDRVPAVGKPSKSDIAIGGFHFAPGGNASARSGGDKKPCINPYSIYDLNFRPACPDPRGMAFVQEKEFWGDIYLCAADHLEGGTSQFGVKIANGYDQLPQNMSGGRFKRFDYVAAVAVMKYHGKSLLKDDEFYAGAFGVTENSSFNERPLKTSLDAKRTSKYGWHQATGNIWVWGYDLPKESPRPSLFGGSWIHGSNAGSRYAYLDYWPVYSYGYLGARGRSDHLQLA
jgi:hypothetical protein